jgi:capsular polysaccharide export protein
MDGDYPARRRYLFLQGMATQFLARLGLALAKRGHTVKRVNFTVGDRLFWRLPGSVAYRGTIGDWPAFLENRLDEWRITDIVLFGDSRPLHVAARAVAARRGVSVHVFEEGYLRPHWVTLERGGVNANSSLPRDPAWYRREAASLPPWAEGQAVGDSFLLRAVQDVLYHGCNWLFAWRYPGYRTHLPLHPFLEYAGWIGRFLRTPLRRSRTAAELRRAAASGRPYFLVPLQLDADTQIRLHSPFGRLAPAVDLILRSFAERAPPDSALLIKEHPLDPQLFDWRGSILTTARRLGIGERVHYIAGGELPSLLRGSCGVVTVNSTVGVAGLACGIPVVTLATPVYDLPGLTYQQGLDRFWREAVPPDATLFDAFRRVVAHRTQVNGGYFTNAALSLAVMGSVKRLEQATEYDAFAAPQPEAPRLRPAMGRA